MANHLIIGLGGTGGSVIRALRKRIYEEFGKNEPDGKANIEYLYVDSSPKDLNDRSSWKTLGASVHLNDSQKVSIHGMGSNVLDNLYQYPGIESFINENDRMLCNDLGSLVSAGIGGQRRRLGRLLFANNLSGPANATFVARLKERVDRLTRRDNNDEVSFHICAGLAGGTGSGSIVDAIAQIRKEYLPLVGVKDKYKVYLYLYVPEMIVVDPERDAGFYQANGYAALCELNALSVGKYHPFDVTGKSIDEYGSVRRLLTDCNAFESAFLYSNVNENNHKLDLESELPAAVADFIYQKTISADMGGKMARLESCENNDNSPELDEAGEPARSKRFISFGLKRIEYPETEVKEYVSFNFATQAARQMEYNKWVGGIGFEEVDIEEVGSGFQADIDKKENMEKYLLSDHYLMLSKPIIEDTSTKKWKEIGTAWQNWTQFFAENVQNEEEKKNWLPAFLRSCERQFNEAYRGQGVKEFYRAYSKDIKGYAAHIRRNAERILFNEWHTGEKSILEVEKYVSLMIDKCGTRIEKFKENIAKLDNILAGDVAAEIRACEVEWNNIGWLRDAITKKSDKVFAQYKTLQCDKYTMQTKIEGYRYAIDLLLQVKNELEMLRNGVTQFRNLLSDLLHRVVENAESKCKVASADEPDAKILKKYDPQSVRANTKRFITDEEAQKSNAANIRNRLVALLGEETPGFNSLYDKIGDLATFEDMFVNECMTKAESMMNQLAQSDPTQKMTNVNILEKIKLEYNTPEKLEIFVKGLYNSAQSYLQFDTQEMSKGTDKTSMMRMIQLCLPEYNDPTNFRQRFIETFAGVCAGINFSVEQDVSVNPKTNQIVIVAAASGFPLRYVANVANLRRKYDSMMIGPKADFNRMVLHTESFRKPLPSLFEASTIENEKKLRPYITAAFAMGLVKQRENPDTGEKYLAIETKDEFGFSSWTPIGKNFLQANTMLAQKGALAATLTKQIEKIIAEEYMHNAQKAELRAKIVDLIQNTILPLFNGNDQNKDYLAYKKSAIDFMKENLADK